MFDKDILLQGGRAELIGGEGEVDGQLAARRHMSNSGLEGEEESFRENKEEGEARKYKAMMGVKVDGWLL